MALKGLSIVGLTGITGNLLKPVAKAEYAYSVARQIYSDYGGPLVRVETDDTNQHDIGIADGELDTATLLSLANGGNARIVRWYNQGDGAGGDLALINSNGGGALIVQAGVLQVRAQKPAALTLDAESHRYQNTDTTLLNGDFVCAMRGKPLGDGSNSGNARWWGNRDGNTGGSIGVLADNNFQFSNIGRSPDIVNAGDYVTGIYTWDIYRSSSHNVDLYRNGALETSQAISGGYGSSSIPISVGFTGTTATGNYDGYLSEILFFARDTVDRAEVETAMLNHYGVGGAGELERQSTGVETVQWPSSLSEAYVDDTDIIAVRFVDGSEITGMFRAFDGCGNLVTVEGTETLTDNTNLDRAFRHTGLTGSISLAGTKATNASEVLRGTNITEIDFGPNESTITNFHLGCEGCNNLSSVLNLASLVNCNSLSFAFRRTQIGGPIDLRPLAGTLQSLQETFAETQITSLDITGCNLITNMFRVARYAPLTTLNGFGSQPNCGTIAFAFEGTLLTGTFDLTGMTSLGDCNSAIRGVAGITLLKFGNAAAIVSIFAMAENSGVQTVEDLGNLVNCQNIQSAFKSSSLNQAIDLTGMVVCTNGRNAFARTQITSLDFGDANAFTTIVLICENCGSLTTVTGLGSLTNCQNIGYAFRYCGNLVQAIDLTGLVNADDARETFRQTGITSLKFGDAAKLELIDLIAFGCSDLTTVEDLGVLAVCRSAQLAFRSTKLGGAISLNGMVSLENAQSMFEETEITSLTFGNATSITTIRTICFLVSELTSLTLSILPNCTTAQQAFQNTNVGGAHSLNGWVSLQIATRMFSGTNITYLDFGNASAITTIEEIAFAANLTDVDGVENLINCTNASGAFNGCDLPTTVVDKIINAALAAGWSGVTLGISGGTNGPPTPSVKQAFEAAGNTLQHN